MWANVSCCVLRSTSIQACLFASDQRCPAWDWIQVSYSSAFSFGSRRATFALNCNLTVHGSEVLLSPLLCTENALQDVHENSGYQAKLKACGIFTHLCVPRHNEGAEIPFCGMPTVFCLHLTPSDYPHPIISLAPQFLFQPFSHCFFSFHTSCQRFSQIRDDVSVTGIFTVPLSDPDSWGAQATSCARPQSSHLPHTHLQSCRGNTAGSVHSSQPSPPAWPLPSPFSSCFFSPDPSEWVQRHDWVTCGQSGVWRTVFSLGWWNCSVVTVTAQGQGVTLTGGWVLGWDPREMRLAGALAELQVTETGPLPL